MEKGEIMIMGRRKLVRQERSRRFSSERVHSSLPVLAATNEHARQAAGSPRW